jgi:predicted nucleotidyltransferase
VTHADDVVRDAIEVVHTQLEIPPMCVFLFGSATDVAWRPENDVDILYVVNDGPVHRTRFRIDETVVDAFVETPSRLELLLARKEPVVVRMLGEGRLVHGPDDALMRLRGEAAALLTGAMPVPEGALKGARIRAVTLLTSLKRAREALENEYLFSLLIVHAVGGYFLSRSLWPVGERSALRYFLECEPGVTDAVRTMLDRSAEFETRQHAAHRVCTVAFDGLSGIGMEPH